MKSIISTALAGSFVLALATAANAQSPQIPTPVNPFPINPVATDGTPLPSQRSGVDDTGLYAGRSAAIGGPLGFVGGIADTGLNAAGSIAGAGLGVANGVVGTAGNVVGGGVYGAGVR